jgi:heat shock protein HspQ
MRYVAIYPKKGIYLGKAVRESLYSLGDGPVISLAPTYASKEEAKAAIEADAEAGESRDYHFQCLPLVADDVVFVTVPQLEANGLKAMVGSGMRRQSTRLREIVDRVTAETGAPGDKIIEAIGHNPLETIR